MNPRLSKLRHKLLESQLDALLVSQAENRRYLSGFAGSAGHLLISSDRAILAVDFRYVEQAKAQAPDFEVVRIKGEPWDWLPGLASDLNVRRLGFEARDLPFALYRQLAEALGQASLQFIPSEGLVEGLRAVKEPREVERIAEAVALADSAFQHILDYLRPGLKEHEVAWELEKSLRERGSQAISFDIIVASGPNAALPHAQPTERVIGPGEPIVFDLGAKIEGYCSDLSRTIYLGHQDSKYAKIYDAVLGAQLTAIATLEAGMSGDKADRLARTVIEEAGYGEAFGHGLGHGIGLAAHEDPRLGPGASDILEEGMVFTLEPGIYIPGWGGVRIEDVVVMEKGRARVLSQAPKIF
ncbi:MAG TPA: aminopeptidase P family protein [Dehalococcoidia bacterium]|nr:aminopeptidase P family protein [Dehalococcoidia bacterium]